MRLLFFGTPAFAVPSLEGLIQGRQQIVGVITQPDRPKGRSEKPAASAIKETALHQHLPILQPSDLKDPVFLKTVSDFKPDCGVVVAYGRILPPALLKLFPHGVINLHASLLPKFRGAAPIQWALIQGESQTGVTIFRLDEQLDHGPILLQASHPIQPEDTAETLNRSLATIGSRLLVDAVNQIESGQAKFQKQDDSLASHAPPLKKEEGILQWKEDCRQIHNRIRGVQPWPGATTWLNGKLLKILSSSFEPDKNNPTAQPGTVIAADQNQGIWVQTGKGQIGIHRLQLEGGRALNAPDFLRGHPIPPGSILTSHYA